MPSTEVLGQLGLSEFRLTAVRKPFELERIVVCFSVAENQTSCGNRSIGAFELFTEGTTAEVEFGFKSSLTQLLGNF